VDVGCGVEGLKTHENKLAHLRSLARFLDDSIPVPGTRYRVGVEPIVGLVPGIGDFFGVTLSAYIILRAADLGVSTATIVRMIINMLVDGVLGSIPLVGDFFDVVWKANMRNLALLEAEILKDGPLKSSKVFVACASLALLLVMALILSLLILVLRGAFEVLAHILNF